MIRKLPPHLIQQIAAGEVVERPASVLKELIENALDAESTKIDIRYRRGGLDYLGVEDNGQGIDESDFLLALEAHATSKLGSVEDLDCIQSLGFRGEALAATAAVSELTLESSARGSTRGLRMTSHFGQREAPQPVDKRIGTRVSVKGLFMRVPARLKFLKSDRSESLALQHVFRRYALAYPNVQWSFFDEGREKKENLAAASPIERALWFFGSRDPEEWTEARGESAGARVHIIFQRPRYLGSALKGFQIFLNRRPIKDQKLEAALRRGFEGFTEFPREMTAVLFLELPPNAFDVNIHPAKHEVRLLDSEASFSLVVHTLRDALNQDHQSVLALPSLEWPMSARTHVPPSPPLISAQTAESVATPDTPRPLFSDVPAFEYLMSIDQTYWVCRRQQELVLFDQHALHERVLYEELRLQFETQNSLPSQRLLFPLKVSKQDLGVLAEDEVSLNKLGYEVRDWDETQLSILSAPAILKRRQVEALLEIADGWSQGGESLIRNSLATMACHAAVRAHDAVSREEIDSLLRRFRSEDALGHCPHGRPTFVRLTLRDLEKMFHRVL